MNPTIRYFYLFVAVCYIGVHAQTDSAASASSGVLVYLARTTTLTPLGPLPTTFTPADDCLATGTWYFDSFGCDLEASSRTSCCPPGYKNYGYYNVAGAGGGGCPAGYSSRGLSYSIGDGAAGVDQSRTITFSVDGIAGQYCCPDLTTDGWMNHGLTASVFLLQATGPSINLFSDLYCQYIKTTVNDFIHTQRQFASAVLIVSADSADTEDGADTNARKSTVSNAEPSTKASGTVSARTSDNSSPAQTGSSTTIDSTTEPADAAQPQAESSKGGLSTGATAGIAVGIGLPFILIIAYASYRFGSHKKRNFGKTHDSPPTINSNGFNPGIEDGSHLGGIEEMRSQY